VTAITATYPASTYQGVRLDDVDRPLTGEPLSVDLLNTVWRAGGRECDFLSTVAGLTAWLRERELPIGRANERMRAALVRTRTVLRDLVEDVGGADERLNAVLARGLVVRSMSGGQVRERVVLSDEDWTPAWLAADDYLRLRGQSPGCVRRCAQPPCVLYFYDPTGRRRWCSMAGCGNRAKARRHYARSRATGPEPAAVV
jgi:predicted RNA-binding Zn ribbon-like protein